jgi:hypothetical protein
MSWFAITREIMAGCTQPGWEQSGEMHFVGVGGQIIPIFSVILEGWQVVFGAQGASIQDIRIGGRFLKY